MTTISDLPEDLLREIVCRVPLKSMRAVRFTCKRWDTLTKMQTCNEAAGESRVLIMDYNLHLISAIVADVDHPSIESKGKLSRLSLDGSDQQEQVKIIKVFHCDGLLLCVLKDTFKLVVWNPYLGQTRWIEPPSYSYRSDVDKIDRYRYALGYNHEKKFHKILRFMDGRRGGYLCEIYDFDSDLWRTLDLVTPQWDVYFSTTGVPLNGNTYWIAKHSNSNTHECDRLICFDFTSETFGPLLPLPPVTSEVGRQWFVLLSSLKGEKLSLLLKISRPTVFEIWVTDPDPNNVSWSKLFTVNEVEPINFAYSGFFIDEEKKLAMVFDKFREARHTLNIIGEAGLISQVDVDPLVQRDPSKITDHAHVCFYVPSLVQVQIKKRVEKRKRGSKLEIRPCQQNKSRRLDHEEDGPSAKR